MPSGTLFVLGELRPQPGGGRLRPPQLDDPDWLAREYARQGDMGIALTLGVNRKTVRRARERLGIDSAGPGRRRGTVTATTSVKPLPAAFKPAIVSIAARIGEQSRPGHAAPSKDLVAARIVALHEAYEHGDPNVIDDAIIEAAAALGVLLDHRRKLRLAA